MSAKRMAKTAQAWRRERTAGSATSPGTLGMDTAIGDSSPRPLGACVACPASCRVPRIVRSGVVCPFARGDIDLSFGDTSVTMGGFIRSASLTNFAEVARSVGLDPDRLLKEVGVPRRALAEPDLMVPIDSVRQLLET